MQQETVIPEQEVEVREMPVDEPQEAQEVEQEEDTKVPLHALQKERRKRQEAEERVKFYETKADQEEDDSLYESATKHDLGSIKKETIREIEERSWAKSNPGKKQEIEDDLAQFLKIRPHYAQAIADSENRYLEAERLMEGFKPKQTQEVFKQKQQNEAPQSPSTMPKVTAMNANVDVMNMDDAEFQAWRKSKSKRRRSQ